jgi:hypothetical protein
MGLNIWGDVPWIFNQTQATPKNKSLKGAYIVVIWSRDDGQGIFGNCAEFDITGKPASTVEVIDPQLP